MTPFPKPGALAGRDCRTSPPSGAAVPIYSTQPTKERDMSSPIGYASSPTSNAVEVKDPGAIAQMTGRIDAIAENARHVEVRLSRLRHRLLGTGEPEPVTGGSAPTPVRPEIDKLEHSLNRLNDAVAAILSNVGALETL